MRQTFHASPAAAIFIAALFMNLLGPNPSGAAAPAIAFEAVWQSKIGDSGSTPAIYNNLMLAGTNASDGVNADQGVMMCFDRASGRLMGQIGHNRLPHRSNDLPGVGICCTPCVDGSRAYYVSNRGELVCVDLADVSNGRKKFTRDCIAWTLDMVSSLGVYKRDAADVRNPLSSPIVIGNYVYCVTGNGAAFGAARNPLAAETPYVPKPDAPSFLAVNKVSGKVAWSSADPGKNIQYGQWASPTPVRMGVVDGVIFPGGDGFLYCYQASDGRLIWKVDCNSDGATRWGLSGKGTRSAFLAAPTVRGDTVYIAASVDVELSSDTWPIYAVQIDETNKPARAKIKWAYSNDLFRSTLGRVAVGNKAVYAVGSSGLLVSLDSNTGKELWRDNLKGHAQWFASPLVAEDNVFVPVDASLFVYKDGPQRARIGQYDFNDKVITGTPLIADDMIYIPTTGTLTCLKMKKIQK